jgi:hypothetical protein
MPGDMKTLIEKLKAEAVGRCRERIEQAAYRAKGLINGQKPDEQKEDNTGYIPSCGVTSVLKKRHGL